MAAASVTNRFDYVRRHRGVPAKKGGAVVVDGCPGVIIGVNSSGNLKVRMDGGRHVWHCHPTWRVVYVKPFKDKPFDIATFME